MSEAVLIGLIGLGGAIVGALLTAILQPIVHVLLGTKANLQVLVRPAQYRLPQALKEGIEFYRYNNHLNIKPTAEVREHLGELARHSRYYSVDIRNNSKKSIDGVVVSCEGGTKFASDVTLDGTELPTSFGAVCNIGTLRPRMSCHIHVWTNTWLTPTEKEILVTAREFDKIDVRILPPDYVTSKTFLVNKMWLWLAFWICNVALGVLVFSSMTAILAAVRG